jgi:hypothetical protein
MFGPLHLSRAAVICAFKMRQPVDPLTIDTFCRAADALATEVIKSHAPSTQGLMTRALKLGASLELRFNPKSEVVSLDLVFAGGKSTKLFAAQVSESADDDDEIGYGPNMFERGTW